MTRALCHCALAVMLALVGGTSDLPPLREEAYIWQRQWTPALHAAISQTNDIFAGWRVLAAYSTPDGNLHATSPDWHALTHPVIADIRIEGRLTRWDEAALLVQITQLLAQWHRQAIPLAGIEIDHDSATSQLPAYAHFLARLRPLIPGITLSITGLPTWLSSRNLTPLLQISDQFVLQVHATGSAQQGLFDPTLAMLWIKTLSARTAKPFLAALPAYSVRVGRDSNGTIVAVESEVPFLAGGSVSDELMAQPQQVAELLGNLTRQRPAHLAGVIWFRLPTTNDQRAWSPATLRAVITGKPLTTDLTPVLTAGATPGLTIIALANNGSTDAALPQRVTLPAACQLADGAEDYRFDAPALLRNENGILHEHGQTIIGWARCALQPQDIHVQP